MAKVLLRLALAVVLVGGMTAFAASTAEAARPDRPGRAARRPARQSFQLFAGASTLTIGANRVRCGMKDDGQVCVDVSGSPTLGGGSWPLGTPDPYVFNSGIQVAGIIPANAGFAWAGDTVGAWAIDTRGPGEHMQALTGIYNSLNLDDVANWPDGAYTNDTTLFNTALVGRPSISNQDTWMRYWDGSAGQITGRSHTMGVLIEQRSLAWNFPTGNEDIVYFLFRFTNITARNAAVYNGLSYYGYTPADIAEIASIGAAFQDQSESAFNVQIPDDGYTIGNVYAAYVADMDVTADAADNYATASLPFSLALTYKADFLDPSFIYPSSIFGFPFVAAPGFVGAKYLKSPLNPATPDPTDEFGITIFSTYTNPSAANSPFPDPLNIFQGYRYLKGVPGPAYGDQSCQYPASRRLCYLTQAPSDQRQMQSSGPFTLAPGQSEVIVVAVLFAPAVAAIPSVGFDIAPYIGTTNLVPGVVPSGERLVSGQDTLRLIDRAMGWISHLNSNGDGTISQDEVTVIPSSLLDKALVAQAVFDSHFLLPFAPEAPEFYLVPGSNSVTVVWKKSPTDCDVVACPLGGDPYFFVANDPTTALYDPNFRQFDVEGYRIWRGRDESALEIIAAYDYDRSVIYDYTGQFYNADYNDASTGANECAPELGITASCPTFPHAINPVNAGPSYPGVVQVPRGGRVELANGSVLITRADTAVIGGRSGFPDLADTGVPFAFTDNNVRNGYRYFYAVTAFDVNSVKSGPTSLSSPLITQTATPRAPSGQETAGSLAAPAFIGSNGQPAPIISMPSLDRVTGIFSGPMPQTDVVLGFVAFVPQIVAGTGALTLWVDSVVPGAADADVIGANARPVRYFMRVQGVGAPDTLVFDIQQAGFDPDVTVGGPFVAGPASTAQSARYGGDSTYVLYGNLGFSLPGTWRSTSWGRGSINGAPANSDYNGPRWWAGAANENTVNPNGGHCPGSPGACSNPTVPASAISAGALPGVDTLLHPLSYNTVQSAPLRELEAITAGMVRAADFAVYWGASGAVDSVMDLTHRVRVPFNAKLRAGWGILNQASFAGTTAASTPDTRNTMLTWSDVFCVAPIPAYIGRCGGAAQVPAVFQNAAALSPIVVRPSSFAGTAAATSSGNGFIFYLNGHFFLMRMAALPAAGTVWNARFYTGVITGSAAAQNFTYIPGPRPPAVPGLEVRIAYEGTSFDPAVTTDASMDRIHTVPDPYYVTSSWEQTTNSKVLRFVNLPSRAIVRVYSVSGILVNVLTYNDPQAGGELTWNLRNRNNQFVASGVYFYHVEAQDGRTKVGRFTVVNYAQ